jgi:hypothetical protein
MGREGGVAPVATNVGPLRMDPGIQRWWTRSHRVIGHLRRLLPRHRRDRPRHGCDHPVNGSSRSRGRYPPGSAIALDRVPRGSRRDAGMSMLDPGHDRYGIAIPSRSSPAPSLQSRACRRRRRRSATASDSPASRAPPHPWPLPGRRARNRCPARRSQGMPYVTSVHPLPPGAPARAGQAVKAAIASRGIERAICEFMSPPPKNERAAPASKPERGPP